MSITPSDPGPVPVAIEPDPAEALRSRVYMSFAGSVAVGLAIAGLYIGGRLFARATLPQERRVVITGAASRPVVPKPSPLQPASAVNAPVRVSSTFIDPKAGEKYLQLAALPVGYTERYVNELEGKGLHVSVAPGPTETIFRIVMGPFTDHTQIKQLQDTLGAAGIQSMERVY
jgi:SPOR domain